MAEASPPLEDTTENPDDLTGWVSRLPAAEKDRLLARVALGEAGQVRMELLRRYRDDTAPAITRPARRTVPDLLDATARRRADRERRLTRQRADEEAHQEQARSRARERRLDRLAEEGDAAWSRVDALIVTRKPADYDAVVTLLTDFQALAEREDRDDMFASRVNAVRQTHARKPSLIERLDQAGI